MQRLHVGDECTGCASGRVIGGECVDLSDVADCAVTADSRCTTCTFWHRPTRDGTACEEYAVRWVVLIAVVVGTVLAHLSPLSSLPSTGG